MGRDLRGGILITANGKEKAQDIAYRLNKNPYYLDFLSYQSKSAGKKLQ